MEWHSWAQPVWKLLCWGDDCSVTSHSLSAFTKWRANYFFIPFWPWTLGHTVIPTQHPQHNHVQTKKVAHKEPCPLQTGYCEAQACEICLWSCLGMRDYGGFRLRSPKLYVHTLTDGEIHGEQWAQWSFIIQQKRGPRIVERFRILEFLNVSLKTERNNITQFAGTETSLTQ